MNRRTMLLGAGGALMTSTPWSPAQASPANNGARVLSFVNTHTGETFAGAYWEAGNYIPDAMAAIERVMRDHRTGDAHPIDPRLLDQLHRLKSDVSARAPFQIISGYRSAASNAALRANSTGVATRSLHMEGRAIDVRVNGVELTRLRDAAIALQTGGVGYYAASDFVHLDTGRVRRW